MQKDMKLLPFAIVNKETKPYVEVDVKGERKTFSPEEISAMILGKMREIAEVPRPAGPGRPAGRAFWVRALPTLWSLSLPTSTTRSARSPDCARRGG